MVFTHLKTTRKKTHTRNIQKPYKSNNKKQKRDKGKRATKRIKTKENEKET